MNELLPLASEHEAALASIYRVAFAIETDEQVARWLSFADRKNVRVFRRGASVVGGFIEIPMGIFAGGRSVPTVGLAGVAVAAEARGTGVAKAMLSTWLRDLHEKKIATSVLYASTRALYRSVGYEPAGTHTRGTVHVDALRSLGSRDGTFEPLTAADHEAIAAVYREHARAHTGRMDRGPYLWGRVFSFRGAPNHGWLLRGPNGPVAWVTLRQTDGPDDFKKVLVEDHFAVDDQALRRLIGFLSTFGAMARELTIAGPCALWDLMPEHRADLRVVEPWLLRVIHVPSALTERGYPEGFEGTLRFAVDDALFSENEGPWELRVRGGRAEITRVPSAELSLSVRGLASLFTGYATPSRLRLLGELRGPTAHDARLASAFAGNAPELGDFF
jgi:predicted acetyltransferase